MQLTYGLAETVFHSCCPLQRRQHALCAQKIGEAAALQRDCIIINMIVRTAVLAKIARHLQIPNPSKQ
jgi:hypothetical protein